MDQSDCENLFLFLEKRKYKKITKIFQKYKNKELMKKVKNKLKH
jgi:hypothetical protein